MYKVMKINKAVDLWIILNNIATKPPVVSQTNKLLNSSSYSYKAQFTTRILKLSEETVTKTLTQF